MNPCHPSPEGEGSGLARLADGDLVPGLHAAGAGELHEVEVGVPAVALDLGDGHELAATPGDDVACGERVGALEDGLTVLAGHGAPFP